MIAGIETGGTKVLCAVAETGNTAEFVDRVRIPTTDPEQTFGEIRRFLGQYGGPSGTDFDAVGIASFGPVDVDPCSARYGWITSTPKPGWRDTDTIAALKLPETTSVRVVTDVTGAALGEHHYGAGTGIQDLAYVTIGTGVGVGIVVGGEPLSNRSHPELGHLPVRRHPADSFGGICPFHGDCLEGLTSGPAIMKRWGSKDHNLGRSLAQSVELSAYYIAQLMATITYAVAPERIISGGGVMKTPGLIEAVRSQLKSIVGDALACHQLMDAGSNYIVPPALGDFSGVRGALLLADKAALRSDAALLVPQRSPSS